MKINRKPPFSVEQAEDSPGFLLWQTSTIWQRMIKQALEPYNVSHAQFVILATLLWFELNSFKSTQIQIINWTKLDKMTVSKSLKKLAELDLVTRAEHHSDTRAKIVTLTEEGRTLSCGLIPLVENIDSKFFSKLNTEQQQELLELLRTLLKT